MVTLVILLINALNSTLTSVSIDILTSLCLCGIAIEILFVWMPIFNRDKWYKKMSYFKYIFTTLF